MRDVAAQTTRTTSIRALTRAELTEDFFCIGGLDWSRRSTLYGDRVSTLLSEESDHIWRDASDEEWDAPEGSQSRSGRYRQQRRIAEWTAQDVFVVSVRILM